MTDNNIGMFYNYKTLGDPRINNKCMYVGKTMKEGAPYGEHCKEECNGSNKECKYYTIKLIDNQKNRKNTPIQRMGYDNIVGMFSSYDHIVVL